jgi:Rps23 Pro-64 3,4-dihydroxylase Tpa1-like proline 4-hydroxylase
MTEYKKIEDKIVYFESTILDYQKIIDVFEKTQTSAVTDWTPWYAYGESPKIQYGEIKKLKRGKLKEVLDEEKRKDSLFVIDRLVDSMIECARKYAEIFSIDNKKTEYAVNILKENETEIGIYKYFEGQTMGPHVDYNEDNNYLEYTIVVYLNDDYEGGELYFNEFDIKLKPKAGSIVMYPSTFPYTHESLEVLKGRKCLITHHWRNKI